MEYYIISLGIVLDWYCLIVYQEKLITVNSLPILSYTQHWLLWIKTNFSYRWRWLISVVSLFKVKFTLHLKFKIIKIYDKSKTELKTKFKILSLSHSIIRDVNIKQLQTFNYLQTWREMWHQNSLGHWNSKRPSNS